MKYQLPHLRVKGLPSLVLHGPYCRVMPSFYGSPLHFYCKWKQRISATPESRPSLLSSVESENHPNITAAKGMPSFLTWQSREMN